MENIKWNNIFVIPIENENLSRNGIDVHLYCVEKRLQVPFHNEWLLLHLRRDFPFRYHLYAILFNYRVRKQFWTLARQNWQLLKSEVISRAQVRLDKMYTNLCWVKLGKRIILTLHSYIIKCWDSINVNFCSEY